VLARTCVILIFDSSFTQVIFTRFTLFSLVPGCAQRISQFSTRWFCVLVGMPPLVSPTLACSIHFLIELKSVCFTEGGVVISSPFSATSLALLISHYGTFPATSVILFCNGFRVFVFIPHTLSLLSPFYSSLTQVSSLACSSLIHH